MKKLEYIIWGLIVVILSSAPLFSQTVYFVENTSGEINQNTSSITTSSAGVYGMAYDELNSKIYFTNVLLNKIYSAASNGSGVSEIISGLNGPRGIAVDGNNGKLYWAEVGSGKIRSANTDGSGVTDIVTGQNSPVDVALDLNNDILYWSDNGTGAKSISRCDLTGANAETVVSGLDQVAGLDIDAASGKLYWVDFGDNDSIKRSDLDGTNQETIVSIGSGSPRSITVSHTNDKIYWSDMVNSAVYSATRDGASQATVASGLSSPLGVAVDWSESLPVELVSFTANKVGSAVKLEWQTATEVDNYGFDIERSIILENEENTWQKLGFVQGAGNSSTINNYSFSDNNIEPGKYNYRLKQIDLNGSFTYSSHIEIDLTVPTEFALEQNFPNPFNPTTTINYSIANENHVKLLIFDVLGKNVKTLVNEKQSPGSYQVTLNAQNLPAGLYYYSLESGKNKAVKKLTLLK